MTSQPTDTDGSSTNNGDESGAIDPLPEAVLDLKERVTELENTVADQRRTIEEQRETIERQSQRIDAVEEEVSEYREHNESDKAEIEDDMALVRTRTDHIIDDIVELEAAFSEFKGELRRVNGGRSSLEQVVMLPDEVAHRADLTKNQLRAREIASDIKQLAKKAPAGQIVHSASIKHKLTDLYNKAHDTTVARVMDFISDLAGEQCEIIHRNGRRSLVLDDALVDQLDRAEQFEKSEVDGVLTNVVSITTETK